jgi:hypothetical protein
VDAAQRELLSAIPTARRAGAPLAEALAAFGAHLTSAADALRGWDAGPTRDAYLAALDAARREAENVRLSPVGLGFEALNSRVGDVLHPLETIADLERELRRR